VKSTDEQFAIVFAAIGVSYDDASFFMKNLEQTGSLDRTVAFINTASDAVIERIMTPRLALTAAEYLAWEHDMHVLVIITDMTNYCEALRELSAMKEEIPSRRGYPGYMYTDLAMIYERAGRIKGKEGSVTIMPILTMPDDDITHPIPDLTGYITEGQVVLSRALDRKGIYPPIDVFLSLSRMMKEGMTIVGADALTDRDRQYLAAADRFEMEFISQGENEKRTVEETLSVSWDIFATLPEEELKLISREYIEKYLPKK